MTDTKIKTLDDVKADMSTLYEELRNGQVEIKVAAELANITGKHLKAEQLMLAREIFESNRAVTYIEHKAREADADGEGEGEAE